MYLALEEFHAEALCMSLAVSRHHYGYCARSFTLQLGVKQINVKVILYCRNNVEFHLLTASTCFFIKKPNKRKGLDNSDLLTLDYLTCRNYSFSLIDVNDVLT
jgi:hypothetical protein